MNALHSRCGAKTKCDTAVRFSRISSKQGTKQICLHSIISTEWSTTSRQWLGKNRCYLRKLMWWRCRVSRGGNLRTNFTNEKIWNRTTITKNVESNLVENVEQQQYWCCPFNTYNYDMVFTSLITYSLRHNTSYIMNVTMQRSGMGYEKPCKIRTQQIEMIILPCGIFIARRVCNHWPALEHATLKMWRTRLELVRPMHDRSVCEWW